MRIGLSSVYAWRPHVEHLVYLNELLVEDGHETCFLVCDAQSPSCYTRELRGSSRAKECPACVLGGLRSFVSGPFDSLREDGSDLFGDQFKAMSHSSVCTLVRTEAESDERRSDFSQAHRRLIPAVRRAYASARAWIQKRRLEGILLFNGRMDVTRGILEAAKDAGIPVVTVERTWFSDGLLLTPNDGPLALTPHHQLNERYREHPLTRGQALLVARRIASRFLQTNTTEWRSYNLNARRISWPANQEGLKVLILPSSRNEVEGHPDWQTEWSTSGEAIDAVLRHLRVDKSAVVLRCHPNWAERIGQRTGELSETYYLDWAERNNVHAIRSADNSSSLSLMDEADLVIVNGGSAVFEAGALGKPCVTVSPAAYSEAGNCAAVYSNGMLERCEAVLSLSKKEIVKRTLRAGYTHNYRHSQFTQYVRAKSPTRFVYYEGGSAKRIIDLLKSGRLQPDDATVAVDTADEDEVCEMIIARDWGRIASLAPDEEPALPLKRIRRRAALRWLDRVRDLMPSGDT
ncbi:hypothetical protein ABIA99_004627 [Bradyrhizobium sp. LB12.1]|jgi:hypothetical protein|uniref:UDP-N-acetylglucosamine 2-epimerase n=1 Tax=Bradyrhizobium sp. LB12.1 TaxID=3156327 RepID=UPI003390F2D6